MIQWVHLTCKAWARHKRWLMESQTIGWPATSVLGRLMEDGPSAGGAGFKSLVPVDDPPQDYVSVNTALVRMAATQSMEAAHRVLHAHYLMPGRAPEKAKSLRLSVQSYWSQLHAAHAFIAGVIGDDGEVLPESFQKSPAGA